MVRVGLASLYLFFPVRKVTTSNELRLLNKPFLRTVKDAPTEL